MPNKGKTGKKSWSKNDLWIAPSHSLKQSTTPQNVLGLRRSDPSESNRFLELADFALSLKPEKHKKKRSE